MRILVAIVLANVVVSLADWYFFGVLWHEKYKAYPEVWRRPEGGRGEGRAVALSALVGTLTPTVFVLLCVLLGMVRLQQALLLGVGVWLMGSGSDVDLELHLHEGASSHSAVGCPRLAHSAG